MFLAVVISSERLGEVIALLVSSATLNEKYFEGRAGNKKEM